ncbi:SMI1/KNR4 family protein [Flammeovirga yaeyamensis]|uniref:SMI1/KNR4 family protein n=1 Tax=Flammeovirga yaeyamensis TaxID=367791 RepID=A0AAX1NFF7_9BACT|nr:SMI1/KNR4 family protein [Flammeovirga yaeyamensis]MBB3696760.1 hypothetical protein [Flammeovirga yaeyamensis]NMF33427.1 SMI1/KNR4 family protein [Flammeovirga yaeyamensis]QWG05298.1 SMI1/KNR4 family protein [Flammeovirga yaeyamensis]
MNEQDNIDLNGVNYKIPSEYYNFIKEVGPFYFNKSVVAPIHKNQPISDSGFVSINFFLSTNNKEEESILSTYSVYEDQIPEGYLPICSGEQGDLILLNLNKKNYGEVVYWFHEGPYFDSIYFLNNSFNAFMLSLENDDDPIQEHSVDTEINDDDFIFITDEFKTSVKEFLREESKKKKQENVNTEKDKENYKKNKRNEIVGNPTFQDKNNNTNFVFKASKKASIIKSILIPIVISLCSFFVIKYFPTLLSEETLELFYLGEILSYLKWILPLILISFIRINYIKEIIVSKKFNTITILYDRFVFKNEYFVSDLNYIDYLFTESRKQLIIYQRGRSSFRVSEYIEGFSLDQLKELVQLIEDSKNVENN